MKWFDNWITQRSRRVARHTSRRDFLSRVGFVLVGSAAVPLLPVARASAADSPRAPQPQEQGLSAELRVLALLRHRWLSVRLLRRLRQQLSPRTSNYHRYLDRYLPQSSGCEGLHHFVQRLLR